MCQSVCRILYFFVCSCCPLLFCSVFLFLSVRLPCSLYIYTILLFFSFLFYLLWFGVCANIYNTVFFFSYSMCENLFFYFDVVIFFILVCFVSFAFLVDSLLIVVLCCVFFSVFGNIAVAVLMDLSSIG